MSSVQNQIQNQGVSQSILDALRREAYEIVKKARDRGYRYLTPYEFWRLRRFIEYHLDALLPRPQYTPPEDAEIPNWCFRFDVGHTFDLLIDYGKGRICGDDRLIADANAKPSRMRNYVIVSVPHGGDEGGCCMYMSTESEVTKYALYVLSKLVIWPRRDVKRMREYVIVIMPVQHDSEYTPSRITIYDGNARNAVIYTLSELIALGYYTPPILT